MRPELIVAEKEFRDHLTSKRFIAILLIFMLLAVYGLVTGMNSYNQSLDSYKSQQASNEPIKQQMINNYNQQIQDARDRGASAEEIQSLQDSLDSFLNPTMPSILQVFSSFTLLFAVMGMLLSGAIGFDQISKEKEDGSLKTVLSSPIYRDALINGKALGAIATLAVTMAAAFLLTVAILLLYGVVPDLDESIRIIIFFLAALLYCTVFLAISMAMSAISKNSAMAVIYTIGVVFLIILFSVLSLFASDAIAGLVMGPAPPQPYYSVYSPYGYSSYVDANSTVTYVNGDTVKYSSTGSNDTLEAVPIPTVSPAILAYNNYTTKKSQVTSQISDMLNTVSPISDFSGFLGMGGTGISGAILSNQKPYDYTSSYWSYSSKAISVWQSLSYVWIKILGLIAEIIIAFGITYMMFMRMDIR
jgi:ABC-2 type transport system permease protein